MLGLGGLGHLGVQYVAKMGFRTVVIARGTDKGELAKKLGADVYIDNMKQDPAAELQKLGGAKVVLATVTNADDPFAGVSRNAKCPCGSGKKYKQCHGAPGGPTGYTTRVSG